MPQSPATTGPYTARTFEDIAQGMIDYFLAMGSPVTDVSEGSTARTLIEGVAQMAEQFYADQAATLQDAIQQGAYTTFNFPPLPPQPATGYLVFSVPVALAQAVPVAQGTIWQPAGTDLSYATTVAFTLPANSTGYWHVPAQCLSPGQIGNLAAGVSGTLMSAIAGVTVYVEDGTTHTGDMVIPAGTTPLPSGMRGGTDPESPYDMRQRFSTFLDSLRRSTLPSLEAGAKQAVVTNGAGVVTEQVVLARAIDNTIDSTLYTNPGSCGVYIYNGVGYPGGQVTSTALVNSAQTVINGTPQADGYKAAGIPTTVVAATEYQVTLSVTVKAQGSGTSTAYPSALLSAGVLGAIQQFFANYKIGDPYLVSPLIKAIANVPGAADVTITATTIVNAGTNGLGTTVVLSTANTNYTTASNGILVLAGGSNPTISIS